MKVRTLAELAAFIGLMGLSTLGMALGGTRAGDGDLRAALGMLGPVPPAREAPPPVGHSEQGDFPAAEAAPVPPPAYAVVLVDGTFFVCDGPEEVPGILDALGLDVDDVVAAGDLNDPEFACPFWWVLHGLRQRLLDGVISAGAEG